MKANFIKRSDLPKSRRVTNIDRTVVGRIVSIRKHPNANMLRIAQIDIGKEKLQIIFGGPDIEKVGTKVAVTLPGTQTEEGKLKKQCFRKEISEAMICSAVELGLVDKGPDEILILPDNLEIGTPMKSIINNLHLN